MEEVAQFRITHSNSFEIEDLCFLVELDHEIGKLRNVVTWSMIKNNYSSRLLLLNNEIKMQEMVLFFSPA